MIQNVALSKELEAAIEAKMVQEQEAAKAKFIQQKPRSRPIRRSFEPKAKPSHSSPRSRVQDSPGLVQLQIVEKWNGISPLSWAGAEAAPTLFYHWAVELNSSRE